MRKYGAFCEIYGVNIHNRVLEYMLENKDIDFAVGDMAKELDISRPKAYEVINIFVKKGYVKKSRLVGKTTLYVLNKSNIKVQFFIKCFAECLKLVIEQYGEKNRFVSNARFPMAYAKNM